MSQDYKKFNTLEKGEEVKKKIIRLTSPKFDEKEQEPNKDIEVSLDEYISCQKQQQQNNLIVNDSLKKSSESVRIGKKSKPETSSKSKSRNKNQWRGKKPRRGRVQNQSNNGLLYINIQRTITCQVDPSVLASEDYYYYNQNPNSNYPSENDNYPASSYIETYEENLETEDKEPYAEEIYEFDIDPEDGILKPISAIRFSSSPPLYSHQDPYEDQEPKESSPTISETEGNIIIRVKVEENLNIDEKENPSLVPMKKGGYWMNGYEEIVPDEKVPNFSLIKVPNFILLKEEESKPNSWVD